MPRIFDNINGQWGSEPKFVVELCLPRCFGSRNWDPTPISLGRGAGEEED